MPDDWMPVSRPLLPAAAAILPYLIEIDAARQYTNFGPLSGRLEQRLCAHFSAEPGSIASVASATVGLSIALRAATNEEPGLCILPSWTFVATAAAVVNAGLTPYFVDVDRASWCLDRDAVKAALRLAPAPVRAIVIVSPFGAPVDVGAWADLADEAACPIIVDAAAGFDTVRPHPRLTSVVSLHATKAVGAGEGGFILAGTRARADAFRASSNFGLHAGALSTPWCGFNGKMSEYTAAVALAALEGWHDRRARLTQITRLYRHMLEAIPWLTVRPDASAPFATTTLCAEGLDGGMDRLIAHMAGAGIELRRWWQRGCHRMPRFAGCPRTDLPVTEALAERYIGLPFWADMTERDAARVVARLGSFDAGRHAASG